MESEYFLAISVTGQTLLNRISTRPSRTISPKQIHTFENKKWGTWDDSIKKQWDTPMRLGDEGRKSIKGHNLDYYLNQLGEVRENSLREFKNRDDSWLLSVDKEWGWGPTNNYCKWFHVCEHESNHNGQIKYIKGRFPGATAGND